MSLSRERQRIIVDIVLALAVAFTIVLLGVFINFGPLLSSFFGPYPRFSSVVFLLNFLCGWLTVLLVIIFVRWRRTERIRREVETIVSSISPDVLLVVDPNRVIHVCNRSIRRMFGYEPEEVLHCTTDLLYFDRRTDATNRPREIYDALLRDGFHIGVATGRRRNGETFPLEIISAELSGREGAVLLLRDITERVRATRERQILEEKMRQREKLESMALMAGGVVHDLKNFLTIVHGYTEMAKSAISRGQSAVVLESLDAIMEACRRATEVCRQLASYSGVGKLERREVNLSQLIIETVRLVKGGFSKTVTLNLELDENVPPLRGDPVYLRQVIQNLLINAYEAIGDTQGTIIVRTHVQQCDESSFDELAVGEKFVGGRYVVLEVSDTGKGMTEEVRRRAFDPFFSTKGQGRGLGLASVLGIVRNHRGTLTVRSAPGKGCTVSVFLPLFEVDTVLASVDSVVGT